MLFDKWEKKFKEGYQLTEKDKEDAKIYYNENKKSFWKNWRELTSKEKEEWYDRFAKDNYLIDEDLVSYEGYPDLQYFEKNYTTKSGDEIVVFGEYGYN